MPTTTPAPTLTAVCEVCHLTKADCQPVNPEAGNPVVWLVCRSCRHKHLQPAPKQADLSQFIAMGPNDLVPYLYLVHRPCGEITCWIEDDDTLEVLAEVAARHTCGQDEPRFTPEREAAADYPAGSLEAGVLGALGR